MVAIQENRIEPPRDIVGSFQPTFKVLRNPVSLRETWLMGPRVVKRAFGGLDLAKQGNLHERGKLDPNRKERIISTWRRHRIG
jgi:hypothetical protein